MKKLVLTNILVLDLISGAREVTNGIECGNIEEAEIISEGIPVPANFWDAIIDKIAEENEDHDCSS